MIFKRCYLLTGLIFISFYFYLKPVNFAIKFPCSTFLGHILKSQNESKGYSPGRQLVQRNSTSNCTEVKDLPLTFQQCEIGTYESLLGKGHPEYLENYQTPCWSETLPPAQFYTGQYFYQHINPRPYPQRFLASLEEIWSQRLNKGEACRIRCLPYYYIAGFAKSGTTDMFRVLQKLPLVVATAAKEVHWWTITRTGPCKQLLDREKYFKNGSSEHQIEKGFASPIRFYADIFDKAALTIERETSADGYHRKIFGDGSPDTMWNNIGWEESPENRGHGVKDGPLYHVAHYIREVTPNAHFIVIMRHPADRLYSWYNFRLGHSPDDFHELSIKAVGRMKACLQQRSLWSCVNDITIDHFFRLRVSMYYPFVKEWLKVFPRKQFYFTTLEEFGKDRIKIINEISKFLGIGDYDSNALNRIVPDVREIHARMRDKKRRPMLNTTMSLLEAFFTPYNNMLADLLQDTQYLFKADRENL